MKPKKRQKLCHNCEGDIDVDVIVCPFCAADLREEKPEQRFFSYAADMAVHKSPEPLYPASYSAKERAEEVIAEPDPKDVSEGRKENIFAPTILFTLGVQLFIFGLLMLLFSHKGVVMLKWDARYWVLYVFGSIPFLFFGYKALSKL